VMIVLDGGPPLLSRWAGTGLGRGNSRGNADRSLAFSVARVKMGGSWHPTLK
jgi:hypothetical protein